MKALEAGWATLLASVLVGGGVVACSATNDATGTGGAGASGTGNSGVGADGVGNAGVGAGLGVGGGTGGLGEGEVCQAIAQEATPKLEAADIIFGVDTSGSMGEESGFVNAELDGFSQQIINSGVDAQVIMLAESPPAAFPCIAGICPPGVCVEAPLGSGTCPNDSNPPVYTHFNQWEVSSSDGLQVFLDSYADWGPLLRPGATKTFVIITDDDAATHTAADFISQMKAKDPQLSNFVMHGIYCINGNANNCASTGTTWNEVISMTGGIHGDLAQQQFKPIFDQLATQIIVGAGQVDCEWQLPAPPDGQVLDPAKVNVDYTDGGGNVTSFGKVPGEGDCDPSQGGWYYNDNNNPTAIKLCQASCDTVKADPAAAIDILFGCETEPLIPN